MRIGWNQRQGWNGEIAEELAQGLRAGRKATGQAARPGILITGVEQDDAAGLEILIDLDGGIRREGYLSRDNRPVNEREKNQLIAFDIDRHG